MQKVSETLFWFPELGYGFYPVKAGTEPYDEEYFNKYKKYEHTTIGKALNDYRTDIVERFISYGVVIDVGIGCGTFVQNRVNTYGYDVNPEGVRWLEERGLYRDPYEGCLHATCWDSLEHIPEPEKLLEKIDNYLFVSLPIFTSAEHVLRSRHYRKDEHYWYFTRNGFVKWLDRNGFEVVEHSSMESVLGREDIETFVAHRRRVK